MSKIENILIIDDDVISVSLSKLEIDNLNIANEVCTAKNGKEGLEKIISKCTPRNMVCPELILLDHQMPVMNGLEFLEEFNQIEFDNKSEVIIILLTNFLNCNNIEKYYNMGISKFMAKPLRKDAIIEMYKRYFLSRVLA